METSLIEPHSRYVIHPENVVKMLSDVTGFLIIVYQTVTVPFSISFDYQNLAMTNFDYFVDIFFIMDIFVNFNTGFYTEGVLIMDRYKIFKSYFKGWMIFDIISSFPYSFIFDNMEVGLDISSAAKNAPRLLRVIRILKFIKILRLLKMVKLRSVFFKFEELLNSDKIQGLYIYFKTMIIFFFIWHFLACIWFSISMGEAYVTENSFGRNLDMKNMSLSDQYGTVLYFIFTTFFTIGYGDFHPITVNEKFFAMMMMLLSYGLFCFMVSTIRNIIQRTIETEGNLRKKLRNVKSFFRDKNLPKELTSKVTKFLEFMFTEKESRRIEDNDIFMLLNDKLGNELRIEMNKRILLNFALFMRTDFDQLVNKFCNKVYEEINNPNEIIISEGDLVSKRMYFIDKGNVFLYHDATTIIYKELGVCDFFGEFGFFTLPPRKEKRTCSAITKTFCNIYFILQTEFLSLIKNSNDTVLQKEMTELFDNQNRQKLFQVLSIKCFYCKQPHFVRDCTTFHKNENLVYISKDREAYFASKLKNVNALNEFKVMTADHFEKLKATSINTGRGNRRKALQNN